MKVLNDLMVKAEKGDPDAQLQLAQLFAEGEGVDRDIKKATKLYSQAFDSYLKAAHQNDGVAQATVGCMLQFGIGVRQNYSEAVQWYLKAAEKGIGDAENNLGVIFEGGGGVEENFSKAMEWYRRASDHNYPLGSYNLGFMYIDGKGVTRDLKKGMQFIRKAAKQGHEDSKIAVDMIDKIDGSINDRFRRLVTRLLLIPRWENGGGWYWLRKNVPPSERDANKFLFASCLDYQMKANVLWERAKHFCEEVLEDPPELWKFIEALPETAWERMWGSYPPHTRYPNNAAKRIRKIAHDMVNMFDGDARLIWENQSPGTVLQRLIKVLGGDQIPRMVVGALKDTNQIHGPGTVKVDTHVKRVLGRLLIGREYFKNETAIIHEQTKIMYTWDPWLLDQPLYTHGRDFCMKSDPPCSECYLNLDCTYAENQTPIRADKG